MFDEGFNRQRRSLNIISFALIAYFTTGAELGSATVIHAVDIRYEWVAYTLIWMAFFYFWWRLYLFGTDAQRHWKIDFLYELSKNRKYRRLYAQPESENQDEHMVWAPALHGQGFRRYLSWEEAYLVGLRDDDGRIQYADASTFSESINPVSQRWNVGPDTVIPLSTWHYFWPALKANLTALTNKSGIEWAFPNFMACFALICGISSLITKFI